MTKQTVIPGSFEHVLHTLIDTYEAHLASGDSQNTALHAAMVAAMAVFAEAHPKDKGEDEPSNVSSMP